MLPARSNPKRAAVSRQASIPAPTSGWYVGKNIADAPAKTALVMDNWFPSQDSVRFRRGSEVYATLTGVGDPITQLMSYNDGATKFLFAATHSAIFDITGGGAISSPEVSGLGSGSWQYVQFTTSGGHFLRCVNGADTPLLFDGSAWDTSPAITGSGLDDAKLNFVWEFKNRLYFIESETMNAWYLPVDSIAGTATKFPLGSVFTLGGSLVAGASWAISSTSGLYETCVFFSSEGEVAMYAGSYPGDTEWAIKGKYKIGKPLGPNCILKGGGDLAVMTEDGIVPMSKVMTLDRIALANAAITYPIAPAWGDAVTARVGLSGWSITSWPLESMAILTLPQVSTSDKQQFVANARSGAWCRYTGWDAKVFAVHGDDLYFGSSEGLIYKAEVGGTDNGEMYSGKLFFSFSDFGAGAARKQIKAARPVYKTTFNVSPQLSFQADFDTLTPSAPSAAETTPVGAALWDVALWDEAKWAPESYQSTDWISATGFGATLAPVIQVSVSSDSAPDLRMQQIDVLYEIGSPLG